MKPNLDSRGQQVSDFLVTPTYGHLGRPHVMRFLFFWFSPFCFLFLDMDGGESRVLRVFFLMVLDLAGRAFHASRAQGPKAWSSLGRSKKTSGPHCPEQTNYVHAKGGANERPWASLM